VERSFLAVPGNARQRRVPLGPGDNRVPLDISSRRVMIVPRCAHG
jgi:hypothetical protein